MSASDVGVVTETIRKQEHGHRVRTFQEEFRWLLGRYRVEYNEACVWD